MGVDVDHGMVRARGDRCDQGAFDDLMGRVLEEKAVFEGTGFVLVAVADNELVALLMCRDHLPLSVRWETRSAHAAQRLEIVDVVVQAARGRVSVIAGVAATTTREAVALARAVMERGADGVLAILEAYFPVSEQGVEDYFRAIAAAVDGPDGVDAPDGLSVPEWGC